MATGFNESVFAVKEKIIGDLEDEFHRKLKTFSSEVKTTMRAVPTETAMRVFEVALVFLTQAFPNLTDLDNCSDEDERGRRNLEDKLDDIQSKVEDLEKTKDYHQEQMGKMKAKLHKHGKNLRKLNESSNTFNENILSLKRIQALFNKMLRTPKTTTATAQTSVSPPPKPSSSSSSSNQTPKTTTATAQTSVSPPPKPSSSSSSSSSNQTPTTTTATAQASVPPPTATTSSSQASAAASPRGPPKSLSQKHRFSAQVSGDSETPDIRDVKLLPGGLVLLTDSDNECVKLFNTQGQHLHSQSLDGNPVRLAVMDITSVSGWDVAVSVLGKNKISILRVSNTRLSVKTSLSTSDACRALAAVNAQTLAVGYWGGNSGIDLINLTGQVLHHLTSGVHPWFMATTPDRCLVVSTFSKTLVKLRLVDGATLFDLKVAQIGEPQGISCHQDGSTIVVDYSNSNSLHLVNPHGRWVRQLLDPPGDLLWCVSTFQDVCVSCSDGDIVAVYDIVF